MVVLTCTDTDCDKHLESRPLPHPSNICGCGSKLVKAESRYLKHGHLSREAYLKDLAVQYNVTLDTIDVLADMLGEEEDFDGLVSSLEDLLC